MWARFWHVGSCWFQTGDRTRKAKNVAHDPRCTISVATKGFDVMVAGVARRVTDPKVVAEIAALWAKSGWPAQPDESGTGITAPFNAPTLGPPPWFVYEVKPLTATAVGTAEDTPGSNALAVLKLAQVASRRHGAVGGRSGGFVAELERAFGIRDRFDQPERGGHGPVGEHALTAAQ